jgi:hypothetical protein
MLVTACGQSPYGRSRCAMRQLCGQDTQHECCSNAPNGGNRTAHVSQNAHLPCCTGIPSVGTAPVGS